MSKDSDSGWEAKVKHQRASHVTAGVVGFLKGADGGGRFDASEDADDLRDLGCDPCCESQQKTFTRSAAVGRGVRTLAGLFVRAGEDE